MEWRVLPLEIHDAYTAMAVDEAISDFVSKGSSPPTIRFWRWNPSAVSIGYFQSISEEVNLENCRESHVDVVRRRTGGGAVYHDYHGEITYSVIGPENLFPKGIHESYSVICGWVIDGLKNLDLNAEFKPINDIILNGKKISGNAQTRRNNVLLQHGTILYDLDVKKMFSLLRVSKEKISDKMIQAVEERVTKILNHKDVSMSEVYEALLKGFTKDKKYEFGKLKTEELKLAKKLATEKYSTSQWNFMR